VGERTPQSAPPGPGAPVGSGCRLDRVPPAARPTDDEEPDGHRDRRPFRTHRARARCVRSCPTRSAAPGSRRRCCPSSTGSTRPRCATRATRSTPRTSYRRASSRPSARSTSTPRHQPQARGSTGAAHHLHLDVPQGAATPAGVAAGGDRRLLVLRRAGPRRWLLGRTRGPRVDHGSTRSSRPSPICRSRSGSRSTSPMSRGSRTSEIAEIMDTPGRDRDVPAAPGKEGAAEGVVLLRTAHRGLIESDPDEGRPGRRRTLDAAVTGDGPARSCGDELLGGARAPRGLPRRRATPRRLVSELAEHLRACYPCTDRVTFEEQLRAVREACCRGGTPRIARRSASGLRAATPVSPSCRLALRVHARPPRLRSAAGRPTTTASRRPRSERGRRLGCGVTDLLPRGRRWQIVPCSSRVPRGSSDPTSSTRLLEDGRRVIGVDDLSTGSLANLAEARQRHAGRFEFDRLDIRQVVVVPLVERLRPEVIFHLAAQVSVAASVADPMHDADGERARDDRGARGRPARRGPKGRLRVVDRVVRGHPESAATDRRVVRDPGAVPVRRLEAAAMDYLATYEELYGLEWTALTWPTCTARTRRRRARAAWSRPSSTGCSPGHSVHDPRRRRAVRDFVFVDDVVHAFVLAADRARRRAHDDRHRAAHDRRPALHGPSLPPPTTATSRIAAPARAGDDPPQQRRCRAREP
jgi:UDP-glucose 4-epimerase